MWKELYMVLKLGHYKKQILGQFWNVVLEKDGEDQLHRSCEKWVSIT
jgi:hypothetical protein